MYDIKSFPACVLCIGHTDRKDDGFYMATGKGGDKR